MKPISFLFLLFFSSYNYALAADLSCIPYYNARLETLSARLNNLAILGPIASGAAGLGLGGVAAVVPGAILLEEVTRIKIEMARRKLVMDVIRDSKKIVTTGTYSPTNVSVNGHRFFNKLDRRDHEIDLLEVAEIIVDADEKQIFCNGDLKNRGYQERDHKFRKNLATEREFKNFVKARIDENFPT